MNLELLIAFTLASLLGVVLTTALLLQAFRHNLYLLCKDFVAGCWQSGLWLRCHLARLGLAGDLLMAVLMLGGILIFPLAWFMAWPWWAYMPAGIYTLWAALQVQDYLHYVHTHKA